MDGRIIHFAKSGATFVEHLPNPVAAHDAFGGMPAPSLCLECAGMALAVLAFSFAVYGLVFWIGWLLIRPRSVVRMVDSEWPRSTEPGRMYIVGGYQTTIIGGGGGGGRPSLPTTGSGVVRS